MIFLFMRVFFLAGEDINQGFMVGGDTNQGDTNQPAPAMVSPMKLSMKK